MAEITGLTICGSDGAPKCTCGADATTPLGMHRDHCAAQRWSHGRCICCGDRPEPRRAYCGACIANMCPEDDEQVPRGTRHDAQEPS